MKKTRIDQISDKQYKEIALRGQLKKDLVWESRGHCMTCGNAGDWRGLSLSHIIPLSRGGKTTRENCLLECYPCHEKYEKHPELRGRNDN